MEPNWSFFSRFLHLMENNRPLFRAKLIQSKLGMPLHQLWVKVMKWNSSLIDLGQYPPEFGKVKDEDVSSFLHCQLSQSYMTHCHGSSPPLWCNSILQSTLVLRWKCSHLGHSDFLWISLIEYETWDIQANNPLMNVMNTKRAKEWQTKLFNYAQTNF